MSRGLALIVSSDYCVVQWPVRQTAYNEGNCRSCIMLNCASHCVNFDCFVQPPRSATCFPACPPATPTLTRYGNIPTGEELQHTPGFGGRCALRSHLRRCLKPPGATGINSTHLRGYKVSTRVYVFFIFQSSRDDPIPGRPCGPIATGDVRRRLQRGHKAGPSPAQG